MLVSEGKIGFTHTKWIGIGRPVAELCSFEIFQSARPVVGRQYSYLSPVHTGVEVEVNKKSPSPEESLLTLHVNVIAIPLRKECSCMHTKCISDRKGERDVQKYRKV